MMRLGLSTPQVGLGSELQGFGALSFDSEQDKHTGSPCATSDLESTHCSDSDQGSTISPSTEQELMLFSELDKLLDIGFLDLDSITPKSDASDTSIFNPPPGLELPSFEMPNPGSALHGSGTCNPCAWFWKPSGCQSNLNCGFCHMCPEGELKNRKKAKRDSIRLVLASWEVGHQGP